MPPGMPKPKFTERGAPSSANARAAMIRRIPVGIASDVYVRSELEAIFSRGGVREGPPL